MLRQTINPSNYNSLQIVFIGTFKDVLHEVPKSRRGIGSAKKKEEWNGMRLSDLFYHWVDREANEGTGKIPSKTPRTRPELYA
jgi:hypothetical protein